jgi:hypothetical protein
MLQTIEVMVEPNGNIRFLENLKITKPTKALLTLLETPLSKVDISKRGSGEAVLKFLHQNSLKQEHRRSIEEINKYIEQERNAWE